MITLRWDGDLRFKAVTDKEARWTLDSEGAAGASPMDALLGALCGCMGIDVVDILTKMRQPPASFEIRGSGERNADPPRFFTSVDLVFTISGDVEPEKAERAVKLSFDRYCSVFHTLRPDLKVTHRIEYL